MPWTRMEVVALNVDQGMGNLIKIYVDDGPGEVLKYLVLIDLGSKAPNKGYAGLSITGERGVIKALQEMSVPKLQLVVISHQDSDHWNLLPDLANSVGDFQIPLQVGEVWKGGLDWSGLAGVSVNYFASLFGGTVRSFEEDFSCLKYSELPTQGDPLDGVLLRILSVNIEIGSANKSKNRNGTSAVVWIEAAPNNVIFPGDAIKETLAFINEKVEKWRQAHGGANPILPTELLSVPHHGSLTTLAGNRANPDLRIAQEFANLAHPQQIVSSSGKANSYRHPDVLTLETLGAHAKFVDEHPIEYYDWFWRDWVPTRTTLGWFTTAATDAGTFIPQNLLFTFRPGVPGFEITMDRQLRPIPGGRRLSALPPHARRAS